MLIEIILAIWCLANSASLLCLKKDLETNTKRHYQTDSGSGAKASSVPPVVAAPASPSVKVLASIPIQNFRSGRR